MTAATAVTKILAALPKTADRDALRKAHQAAEAFHRSMAEVLEAEEEAEGDLDVAERIYWENKYRDALGASAVAALKMPMIWLAILDVKIEAITTQQAAE